MEKNWREFLEAISLSERQKQKQVAPSFYFIFSLQNREREKQWNEEENCFRVCSIFFLWLIPFLFSREMATLYRVLLVVNFLLSRIRSLLLLLLVFFIACKQFQHGRSWTFAFFYDKNLVEVFFFIHSSKKMEFFCFLNLIMKISRIESFFFGQQNRMTINHNRKVSQVSKKKVLI